MSFLWRASAPLILILLAFAPPAAAGEAPEEPLGRARELLRAQRFDEALAVLEQAREISEAAGDRLGVTRALLKMGDLHRETAAPSRALAALDTALALTRDLGEAKWEARVLRQRAQAHGVAGSSVAATVDLAAAAELYRDLGETSELAGVEAVRAVMASQEGRYQDAVERATAALPTLEEEGRQAEALGALSALAFGLQELDRLDEALEVYEELVHRAWQRNDQRLVTFAYCNLADVRRGLGEPGPAEEELREAVAGFERGRAAAPEAPEARWAYLARQVEAYDRLILLLADSYRGDEAFEVAERFRARSLLEQLAGDGERRASDPELRQRERALLATLGRLQLEAPGAASSEDGRFEQLEAVKRELAEVRARLHRGAEAGPLPAPDAARVRRSLADDEALVAYWVSRDRLLAWASTEEGTRFVQIPVSRQDLTAAVEEFLALLRSAPRAEDAALLGAEERHLAVGRQLHRWLIGSLPAPAHRARRLLLVPDDVLHYLPFEALVASCDPEGEATGGEAPVHEPYRRCRYLGLEQAVAYAPSASTFLALRKRPARLSRNHPTPVLAVAPGPYAWEASTAMRRPSLPPLAHDREEARRVAQRFPGGRTLLGADASKERFAAEARGTRILHLVAHGLVDDSRPLTSGVLLAPGGAEGLLMAAEVARIPLEAELVTLSACRTARGELRRGEGLAGLAQAFLEAGAQAVVASLWDVDDRSTPMLMDAFYRYLLEGEDRAEALRRARLELFAREGSVRLAFRERPVAYAHPRFWSGFVLFGLP